MFFPAALGVLAVTSNLALAPSRPSDLPRKAPEPGAHRLTQEVYALRTLFSLRLTPAQLQILLKLSKETMAKDRDYKKSKVSDDYRTVLTDLRKALVEADDEERVAELDEKVKDVQESEKPDIDDHYEVTEAARAKVPGFYKLLKPPQLVVYFAAQIEDVLDPLDELVAYLEAVRELKADEWKDVRDELAEELAWQVGGLDAVKAEKVYEEVASLLNKARELTDEEFKKQKPALEKKARKTIGNVDPTDVLRHYLERTLADLLSNPRLEEVLNARLEPEK